MRLEKLVVDGLFGLFDHTIPFNLEDRITIIHAPNGYGKTVLLKLIQGFFGGSLAIFRAIEYGFVVFEFNDGSRITITRKISQGDLFGSSRKSHTRNQYTINYFNGEDTITWEPFEKDSEWAREVRRQIPSHAIDRYVPFVAHIGPDRWRDATVGDVVGIHEVVERYAEYLPHRLRQREPLPDWLEAVRGSVDCQLIETQRLMIVGRGSRDARDGDSLKPAVTSYAADLAGRIGRVLAESATLSQSLDRTFPNRLLARMRDQSLAVDGDELRDRLAKLEQKRERLAKAGLSDKTGESEIIPREEFDEPTRKILSEYVDDTVKKLSAYDDILSKIELFTEIINQRFQFKSMSIDRERGFIFTDIRNRAVSVESLSSGEQHELILIFDLLFRTKIDTLLLIDEPEISLHIAWQKRFLSDLRRIIELTHIDVVLSTHSPQIVGAEIGLIVQLEPPRNAEPI